MTEQDVDQPQGAEYWINRPLNDPERDWKDTTDNWVNDYWLSQTHPHRDLILEELTEFQFSSLAEVGCNAGPNLARIHDLIPYVSLKGIDVSPEAVLSAQRNTAGWATVEQGTALRLPWDTQSIDVLLYDAVLMYVDPDGIKTAMEEIERVAKKAVILVERHANTTAGEIVGHVWSRDYTALLEERGFKVKEVKITKDSWPTSLNWQKHGRMYVALAPSLTSENG